MDCTERSSMSFGKTKAPVDRSDCEDLRCAAYSEATLQEAFLTFLRSQEEQAHTAADLLDREVWATTALLEASDALWDHLAEPTVRFAPDDRDAAEPCYLELGRFRHLAALISPSEDERRLLATEGAAWARIAPHRERQLAGETGALACGYVVISTAEAVAALGFGRILDQIEAATRSAGTALLAEAKSQKERQVQLARVERMLGWDSDPSCASYEAALPAATRLLLSLAGQGGRNWVVWAAMILGVIVLMLCLLIGIPHILLALVPAGPGLFIWKHGQT